MENEFKSLLKLKGTLVVRVRDAVTQRVLRTVIKRNTITYDAGNIVRALLAQRAADPAASAYKFGSMRFGVGTTTPLRSDVDLEQEVTGVRKELTDVQKTNGGSGEITLTATLQASEGNGYTYSEAGVFTLGSGSYNDNQGAPLLMFSRQVHTPLQKTSSVTFNYSWTFQFTT